MKWWLAQLLGYRVVLLLGLALLVRLPNLTGSFWMDEAAQALESARPFLAQHQIPFDFQPPLLHYLVHGMVGVSRQEWWLRMVSVISGVATVGVVYALARLRGSHRQATLAALLLACSPFHIFFSQELRPYALATLWAALSWLFLLRWERQQGRREAVMYGLSVIAGLYSMYLFPFVVLSQVIYIALEKRAALLKLCLILALCGVAFLPWLPMFATQLTVGGALTGNLPGWSSAVATPQLKALPLIALKFFTGQVKIDGVFVPAVALLCCVITAVCIYALRSTKHRWILYWLLVPVLTAWLVSFFVPVIAPKRVMVVLPAVFLCLAFGITQLRIRWAQVVLPIGILAISLWWWGQTITTPSLQREDWRGLIQTLEHDAGGRQTQVLFAFYEDFSPWQWYGSTLASVNTGRLRVEDTTQVQESLAGRVTASRIYVFEYLRDLTDPDRSIDMWLVEQGYSLDALIPAGDIGFVRVYNRVEKSS